MLQNNNSENNKKSNPYKRLEEKRKGNSAKSIVPQKKRNLIRAIKIVVIVFAVLLAVYFVLSYVDSSLKLDGHKVYDGLDYSNNSAVSVDYYNADYSVDIFTDEEYLKKDRVVRYVDGNVTIVLDEYDDILLDAGQRFFKRYFDAVIHGDYESYGEMIAKDYDGNPIIYGEAPQNAKFPMQRLYDITVKKLAVSDDAGNRYNGKHAVFGVYEVSYRVMKNDGDFRLGLPSDKIVPVIYETATTNVGTSSEKTVITRTYLYDNIIEKAEES